MTWILISATSRKRSKRSAASSRATRCAARRGDRRQGRVSVRPRRKDGRTRADGFAVSRRVRRLRAPTRSATRWRCMEIARADASTAITLAAHVSLGATPFYLVRHRSAETAVPRSAGARRDAVGLRADRAAAPAATPAATQDARRAARRKMDHQRHEGLHHQQRDRHHRRHDDHGGDRHRRARAAPRSAT